MTGPRTYRLYGLTFRSAVDLPEVPTSGEAPIFSITTGDVVAATTAPPRGDLLLDFTMGQPWYSLAAAHDHYRFRVYGVCDFVITKDLSRVILHPVEDMTPGMDSIIITGTLLALQLYLRGHLVLHASAVQTRSTTVGFVGHSGSGKTTLATIMCTGGAAVVVTDDVLRVDFSSGRPVARLGARELRLRSGTESLHSRFDPGSSRVRTSADHRSVLRPPGEASDRLHLGALVLPRPTRDSDEVRIERLSTKDALMAILSFPRLMGWQDPLVLSQVFSQVGKLVAQVPVLVAQVPWGPPFPADLGGRLRQAIDSAVAG